MGVVGTLFAVLLVFLLWRFCIRRKGKNGGNMNPIAPQYHPVPTIPQAENGTNVPFNDNLAPMRFNGATSHYGLGIQKYAPIIIILFNYSNSFFNSNTIHQPPNTLSYDRSSISSYSGLPPPTLYTNQSTSSLPRTQQIHHNPQERLSSPSMMSDRPPMYSRNPTLDESAATSSSSSNSNSNEKNSPLILTYKNAPHFTEDEMTSIAMPGRHEENNNSWDSGYPNH